MFDETLRAIRQLEQGLQLSVDLPLDENGCFDRRCPSPQCDKQFKIVFDDWRDKVADERVFCPYCRFEANAKSWTTSTQEKYIESVGLAHITGILDRAMAADARHHNLRERTHPRGGLIDISMTMNFKPGSRPLIVPLAIAEALRQDFTCEICSCRWSSLGSSFFCPACGHNSVALMFDRTMATVRHLAENVSILTAGVPDPDAAADALRQILEDQIGRLVGTFERFSEALCSSIPEGHQAPRKGNVFQRVDDASTWWRQAVGLGYEAWLLPVELIRLRIMYQRRHLLTHQQGIVDQAYLDRSGDLDYRALQRIVVRASDVLELVSVLEKLAAGIRTAVGAIASQTLDCQKDR